MKGESPSAPPPPSARRSDGPAAVFLALLTLALFNRFLWPATNQVLSVPGEDLFRQFVWWRQFGFGELRQGHLALWNPHLFCGAPFFGGFQSALLYPPNWLFMVLPMPFAMNLSMALHVFLAGWFTYLWIRKRGSPRASALLAALMFMFSGAFFLRITVGNLSNLCTMAWIPLILLAVEGLRRERRWRWVFMGALAVALQIFAGHIQYVYYTALVLTAYVFWVSLREKGRASFLGGFLLIYALGGLLSAVQVLAGWDASMESIRGKGLPLDILSMLDMNPERLCYLLMPRFFGNWSDYWGGGIYCEGHPYVGTVGFVLALAALRFSRNPDKRLFAGMALFLTVLMLGLRTPLFVLACKWVPLFSSFRAVSRFNILVAACLAALAAMGLDEILKSSEALRGLSKALAWTAGVLGALSAVFFAAPRMGGERLFKQFLPHADGMAASLFWCGALMAGLSLLSFLGQRRDWMRLGFLAATLVELTVFAQANMAFFDMAGLQQKVAAIQAVYDRDPGDYRVWVEKGDYTLGTTGLDIWGEDPVMPSRYALFAAKSQELGFADILKGSFFTHLSQPLGLLRLRYVFRGKEGPSVSEPTGLKEVPRAFLTGRWEVMGPEAILGKVTDPSFDPRQEALLETDPGLGMPGEVLGTVKMKDLDSDRIEIEAETPKPAVLVVTDNYSRGWKVEPLEGSDQKAFQVIPAYGFQRAVPLGPGRHHFLMEYRPAAFEVGKWISLFSWAAFLILFPFTMRGHENRR